MDTANPGTPEYKTRQMPWWLSAPVPLLLLAALVAVFFYTNPLAMFGNDLPPIESLTIERIELLPEEFVLTVFNGGPHPVKISQVMVDDAFWQWEIEPSAELPRLSRATVRLRYPWVFGEPHAITLVTSTGTTFTGEVAIAAESPRPNASQFLAFGLLGIYIGVIPVALGVMWFPAMRRMGRTGINFLLALTVGMLVYLLLDTALEAIELSAQVAGVFQGLPLAFFAALLSWLAIVAVGSRQPDAERNSPKGRMTLAMLIALGIGLHNLGEGLVVGAAFALGEAALGSFLVIGFTLHNVTEGIGIAAPVTRDRPSLKAFVLLILLAGLPAVLGAWIGGFAFSPLLATVFFGIGAGAIWQVIVEVGQLLIRESQKEGLPVATWLNLAGLASGIALMYFTAYFVKF